MLAHWHISNSMTKTALNVLLANISKLEFYAMEDAATNQFQYIENVTLYIV